MCIVLSITAKSGVKSNIKAPPPGATLILDANTFDDVIFVSDLEYRTTSSDVNDFKFRIRQRMF